MGGDKWTWARNKPQVRRTYGGIIWMACTQNVGRCRSKVDEYVYVRKVSKITNSRRNAP